jgi:hypothetical protein
MNNSLVRLPPRDEPLSEFYGGFDCQYFHKGTITKNGLKQNRQMAVLFWVGDTGVSSYTRW